MTLTRQRRRDHHRMDNDIRQTRAWQLVERICHVSDRLVSGHIDTAVLHAVMSVEGWTSRAGRSIIASRARSIRRQQRRPL